MSESETKKLPIYRIRKGRYKGKIIDNKTRRSLTIAETTPHHFWADYFFHKGEFYTAKIPRSSLKEIIGQRFSFGFSNPFVNHAQVRLKFKDDQYIELYPLGENEDPLYKIQDCIYSIEVVGPHGEEWTFQNAFGSFVSAHRMISTEEVVFERLALGGYEVIQSPPIKFNQEQLDRALDIIIKRCDKAKMKERYYLVNAWFGANNCTSEVFKILDRIMKKEYTPIQRIIAKVLWRFPVALRLYLRLRGAIDNSIINKTLNEEFKELVESAEVKQRVEKIKSGKIKIQT